MTHSFKELDTVVLTRDIPDAGLRSGDVGAVVHVYTPDVFEVEFVEASGNTVALQTLSSRDIRIAGDEDVLAPPPIDGS